MFKPVDPKVNFVEIERYWLSWWKENSLVEKYLDRNKNSSKRFSFIDGPITANNPMAVHHAWGRTYKDLWQRFKNMQGFKQTFRNGFDNQGLWVEVEVEKQLGFKSKKDIENYGIENFVNKCKESTLHWSKVQTEQSQRLGMFMDWNNSYFTMSDENNYTIWFFLKTCHEKGLIYKGRDSVPWCPRCGTAISQHEILQEEYKELTHDSIYFELPIFGQKNERFLVWTTTPWTIPANVALAVNPILRYQLVEKDDLRFWLVASMVGKIFGNQAKILKEVEGKDLIGLRYIGPFDELPAVLQAKKEKPKTFHTVVDSEELVSGQEGTGIVHLAPGAGGEDFQLGGKKDLPVIAIIGEDASYLLGFADLSGKNAKKNPHLILDHPLLKDFVLKIESFTHRYPVCWRCKTELVWRVVDEWYIKMDPLREPLKKSARQAKWIPDWGLEREIDWLNHMSDWLISKKRYWGLALPIWECECGNFEVIGSKEELKERAIEGFEGIEGFERHSPHRPWIDAVKIKCSKCQRLVSRIPDVGNPWLDAGIVPFSTLIDPKSNKVSYLTNKKYWQEWFPADFVTECFPGQFKNWFYSILAMSTVLEGGSPFKALLGHALVRDEKGEEMHKTKGNAIWFDEAAEKMGVDVMRWMYATQNPELNLNFGYKMADETRRKFHLLLWNVYNFFVTYANIDNFRGQKTEDRGQIADDGGQKNVLDRWILSKLNNLIKTVTDSLENYDAYFASWAIAGFVEDLSTWYIRRSRERVGQSAKSEVDKKNFYSTTDEVLITLTKILAPFTPFLAEEIFKNLSEDESVHLQDWPVAKEELIDSELESKMTFVRQVVEMGHAKRKEAGIKVRQPLSKCKMYNVKCKIGEDLIELIKDELNIKKVEIVEGEGEMRVELDTKITTELKEEGEARDLIRKIQEARKEAGCGLSDKVEVGLPSWPEKFEEEIKRKTLAVKLYKTEKMEIKKIKA